MKEYFPDDEERREASAMQFNGRTEGEKKVIQIFSFFFFFPFFLVHNHQGCLLSYDSRFDYLLFFSVNNNEREKHIIKGSLFAFGYLSSVAGA
jgi:hypothetical protein